MLDQVQIDLKAAMKSKDKERLNAIRYLKSLLLENQVAKSPKAEMDVVTSYLKKLKSNIETFPEGNEQRVKAEVELKILSEYGPKTLEESEVKALIEKILSTKTDPQFGLIMKELSGHIKGRFDGKRATEMVKKAIES